LRPSVRAIVVHRHWERQHFCLPKQFGRLLFRWAHSDQQLSALNQDSFAQASFWCLVGMFLGSPKLLLLNQIVYRAFSVWWRISVLAHLVRTFDIKSYHR